jgi:hypothetical protein
MGKNAMNYFSKIMLGMAVINTALMASEDGKITAPEMISIVTTMLQGMGMAGIDLKGITLLPTEDGGVNLYFPPNVVSKLHINV